MIIFGTKVFHRVLATLSYVCGNCGQPAAHRIFTRWRFFSLFFVPVIPIGRKHYYDTCVACGRTLELTREQAETVVGTPAAPAADLATRQGTPPVASEGGNESPAPGWYRDPSAQAAFRWWDGGVWTDRVENSAVAPRDDS